MLRTILGILFRRKGWYQVLNTATYHNPQALWWTGLEWVDRLGTTKPNSQIRVLRRY